jgi:hypothetical protein
MKQYLAMWDMYGLECLIDTGELHKQYMWSILSETSKPNVPNLQMMLLRAKMNSQRCYEIYSFNADDNLTEEVIKHTFQIAPQGIVDFIRAHGNKIFSDRTEKKVVIT